MCAASIFASVDVEGLASITSVVLAISVRQDFWCRSGHQSLTLVPTSSGTVGLAGPGGLKPTVDTWWRAEAEALGPVVDSPVEPALDALVEQLVTVRTTRASARAVGPAAPDTVGLS